jgi:hypothetical protein
MGEGGPGLGDLQRLKRPAWVSQYRNSTGHLSRRQLEFQKDCSLQNLGEPQRFAAESIVKTRAQHLVGDSAKKQHRERDDVEGLIAQNSVKDRLVAFAVGIL